jgi:chitin synthase
MNNPPVNDLCDLPIDLGTIVKTLKTRSEANLRYTYLGDSMLIAMDPSHIDEQLSTDYVAEYKNTSSISTLPPHLFQLINKTYLHMRRTGIDQTIILR